MNKGITVGKCKISILCFADDIVLPAENQNDCEFMLEAYSNIV